jgi:hypothetical protein
VSEAEEPKRPDEPASAVPDPRDRRRGERRRRNAESGEGDERRQSDRRKAVNVPDEYRAGKRSINEYPLDSEEFEFINAVNAYKQAYQKPFPTWSEVLHVLKSLGYSKSGAPPEDA